MTHTISGITQATRVESSRIPDGLDMAQELSGLTSDSRQVEYGGVFVAVPGVHVDGHDYIPRAIEAGAAVIVCERIPEDDAPYIVWLQVKDAAVALGELASWWYGEPSRKLTLVGVTGTNGKTTIATLLYEMARLMGHSAGLLSTVVNKIDDVEIPSTHTTPDPLELNALLARMVDAGCEFVAMEVSSHAAAQHRIAGLHFDGGVFTNLTRDHLDYHKTFAGYLAAKQSFFDMLPPTAFALTNIDDKNGDIIIQNTRARKYTYSVRTNADFRGRLVEDRLDGMLISLDGVEVETMFAGRFNASNLTAVYGASILLGWEKPEVLAAMSRLVPVCGRFEPVRSADGVTAIVDYAHTPDALVNVLDTINEVKRPESRVITVCGAGGDRDHGKRPMMALEAARRSAIVVLTSDNPRTEDPDTIIADMFAGLDAAMMARTLGITDRHQAIRAASMLARPGDVILLAGKGHEKYQVVGTENLHFDDHEEIRAAFDERTLR